MMKQIPKQQQLDFDQWSDMARRDPDTFESMRLAAIDELIEAVPEERRHRLRCLQWRIDQERHRSRSPLGACIRISHLMWDSLMGREGLLENLAYFQKAPKPRNVNAEPRLLAAVIPFPSKRH